MARYLLKEVEAMCRRMTVHELWSLAEGWVDGSDRTHEAELAAEYLTVPWRQQG